MMDVVTGYEKVSVRIDEMEVKPLGDKRPIMETAIKRADTLRVCRTLGEPRIYAASNPLVLWLPSQNGLVNDAPHRQSETLSPR